MTLFFTLAVGTVYLVAIAVLARCFGINRDLEES